jgi:hypothetical protein
MSREAINHLHGQSGEAVSCDMLPESRILHGLLAAAGFSTIEILDEPDQYVAWGQA